MMLRCARPAMATLFEVWLVGDDEEHLAAVGEASLDEVSRIDRLLSRHDPAAGLARVNREAAARPVRVDRELFAVLLDCRARFEQTDGYFDASITPNAGAHPGRPPFAEAVRLDEEARTVTFLDPRTSLDLGGYGKGYALDAAGRILDEFGIRSALLHGGTSSILARGHPKGDTSWRVGIRDPFDGETGGEVARVPLSDCGVSSSAALDPGSHVSDIIDPISGRPLDRQAACTVVAPTAVDAEVFSTALLAMGKRRAEIYLERDTTRLPEPCRVAWIDRMGDRVWLEWLAGRGTS
jgi:FAD:protein FMN transferase